MPLFRNWCKNDQKRDENKRLWKLTEKADGRETILAQLAETVRSHYDSLERIADDVAFVRMASGRTKPPRSAKGLRLTLPNTGSQFCGRRCR
jgi:hypothetical protein